jgi:hypothetical protein
MRTASAETRYDYDVVVVGGGPAGCSTGVFTARYGLDTAIFDRGRSSIRRCAYLGNYLGFPAGIDVETFCGLIHDHAEAAGCDVVKDVVESVGRRDGGGFTVTPQEGETVATERVVAAARYDAEFLRPLDSDGAMFASRDHGDGAGEQFDREYPDEDGATPIDGVYVAAPTVGTEAQAVTSAGQGARVARTLLADVRRERGFPETIAGHWDWNRSEAELDDEWSDRDRWRAYLDDRRPDDHEASDERWATLREREIERRLETHLSDEEIDRRARRGQKRLLDHLDDDLILEAARAIEAGREPSEGRD